MRQKFLNLTFAGMLLSLVFFIQSSLFAQPQAGFSYQAVARDNIGTPLESQDLTVRISVLAGSESGEVVWQEDHDVITNSLGLFNLVVGGEGGYGYTGSAGTFDAIDWSAEQYFLKVSVKMDNVFNEMGVSPIQTVPVAQYANSAKSSSGNFSVQADKAGQDALFEVRRSDGSLAFAVYDTMVWVYTDETAKGVKGGFAVGGYTSSKGPGSQYMSVTPDSIRMYINTDPAVKGVKGGFAVGGYSNSAKGPGENFLEIDNGIAQMKNDSIRMLINADNTKGVKGGFAVGGYTNSKAINGEYFYVSSKDAVDVVENKPQVLWYPKKEALLAGNVYVPHPDSVGTNATALGFRSMAIGNWSQAFGYKSKARGDYSTAIGREAISGLSSFAFGNWSRAQDYSIAIGYQAVASGLYSTAIGYNATASNSNSISMGSNALSNNTNSISIGNSTEALGTNSTAIGYQAISNGTRAISLGAYYYKNIFIYKPPIFPIYPIFTLGKGAENDPIFKEPVSSSKAGSFVVLPLWANRDNQAIGTYSLAVGNGNLSHDGGITFGVFNTAHQDYASAIGFGNDAVAKYSFAAGFANRAQGYYATAMGKHTSAVSFNSFTIGTYNISTGDSLNWVDTDPLFQIGNGESSTNQHDALKVQKNGGTYIYSVDNISGLWVNTSANSRTSTTYGIISQVVRNNASASYYSGYFYDTGSSGTYNGFYCDIRAGTSADVAEYIYDSHGTTVAGDVIIADPEKKESVIISNKPYQSSVLGIVTTSPHLVMGYDLVMDEKTGEAIPGVQATRLALTGRVPCKVTDENGPIRPGDLVTTSSTPGYAMKWTPVDISKAKDFDELKSMLAENEMRRHAVIGKAVEALEGGTGKIMVLVSLQ